MRGRLSYPDAPNPLAGEDIEHLMQSNESGTTTHYYDVGATGYDAITGFGRPNAAIILERLQLPCYKVRHYKKGFLPYQIMTLEDTTTVTVTGWPSILPQQLPPYGNYTAQRYKVILSNSHDIEGETIIDAWKRDSASDLAPLTTVLPGDGVDVTLDSYNATSATLSGYLYKITAGGTDYWWPVDPYQQSYFAYSLYTKDPPVEPSCTVNLEDEETLANKVKISPNPGNGCFRIQSSQMIENAEVVVHDSMGNKVMTTRINGYEKDLCMTNLARGLYILQITSGTQNVNIKYVLL